LNVHEEKISIIEKLVMKNTQYCIIIDPYDVDSKTNLLGTKKLIKGPLSFFLLPGEKLEEGSIQNSYILMENETLLVQATESFKDENNNIIQPGDRYLINGPCSYIPPTEINILELRSSIPLKHNEGVYVRDIRTGNVRLVKNETYTLKSHEELHELNIDQTVKELIYAHSIGLKYIDYNTRDMNKFREEMK